MTISISHSDRIKIAEAIKGQEAKTSGEIYCVIARKSNDYDIVVLIYAIVLSLLLPTLMAIFNFDLFDWLKSILFGWSANEKNAFSANIIIIVFFQALIFAFALLLANSKGLIFNIIPQFIKRDTVHKSALDAFMSHGLHQTEAKTGVLIYVSIAEHIVEIVADSGIYTKVDKSVWRKAIADVLEKTKSGDIISGLLLGIEDVGLVLAEHFPPNQSNENEISDSVVII